jgi:5-methylcytosine-specific restriction endonuclease McrA
MLWKPPTLKAPQRYGWAKGRDRNQWPAWIGISGRFASECACLAKGFITMSTEVHHLKPISEGGGKYEWANLESVCGDCQDEAHGAKPKIRIDPRTGLPLPGQDHPWSDKE